VNGGVRDRQPASASAAADADCDLDEVLYSQENGVEIALHRAQLWSKFAKDLISFIDKRTNICEFIFTTTVYCFILSSVRMIGCHGALGVSYDK